MKTHLTKIATLLAATLFSFSAQAANLDDQVASGQAAIINALVAGASTYAPAELKEARANLELSRSARAQNDLGRAAQLANMAAASAKAAEERAIQQRDLVRSASR